MGLGVGGLALLGRVGYKSGRLFDIYANSARYLEEYSPGRIFRTFQISHLLSPFETVSQQSRFISAAQISEMRGTEAGRAWLAHLTRLTGREMGAGNVALHGFRFEGGKLLLGQTSQDVLLKHAAIMRAPTGAMPAIQMGYARSLAGSPLFPGSTASEEVRRAAQVFTQKIRYEGASGKLAEEAFMFIGGQNRFQSTGRMLGGWGTSLIERMNQLARSPVEMFSKIPLVNKMNFGVVPSSGLKTFGKLAGKLGIAGTAAYVGYQQLDHMVRQSSLLDNTLLAEGITPAIATVWTRSQKALSSVAGYLGLHSYREKQEEVAPGSTTLKKLAAFPLMGALTAGSFSYGGQFYRQMKLERAGLGIGEASFAAKEARNEMFDSLLRGSTQISENITNKLDTKSIALVRGETEKIIAGWRGKIGGAVVRAQTRGNWFAKKLGRITPGKIGALAGAAVGLAAILPFIPGALVPSSRPEELEEIYSGRKEVAIRKGAGWEFGGSEYEGGKIDRFQKHWYPRMLARAKDKAIYGGDISPLKKFYLENFTYELEKQHYYDRPYPLCLHPESVVFVKNHGYKAIKNVVVDDVVINVDGELTRVVDVLSRKCFEKKLIAIKIAADNRILRVTEEHQVFVIKNNSKNSKRGQRCRHKEKIILNSSPEWIRAKDLKKADIVLIPKRKFQESSNVLLDLADITGLSYYKEDIFLDPRASQEMVCAFFTQMSTAEAARTFGVSYKSLHQLKQQGGYKKLFPRFLSINEDLAMFFGLYLAEGWTEEDRVSFSFNKNERHTYAQFVCETAKFYFNANSTITESQNSQGITVRICSKILKRLIDGLLDKNQAKNKKICDRIFGWPLKLKQKLISGLFRGDGSYAKPREISFVSASQTLVTDIRFLLLSIGIKSSFCENQPKPSWRVAIIRNRVIPKNISYTLRIHGEDYNKFAKFEDEIQSIETFADRKGYLDNNYLYVPIRSITIEDYEGDVYDITVENGESFLSTCIVHNSTPAFQDVPLIGPLLSATLGRIVKPVRIMHEEEWMRKGKDDIEYKEMPARFGEMVAPGELERGAPISPFGFKGVVGEQTYRLTEAIGLPGFIMTSIKEKLTGSQDLFDQEQQLQGAGNMYSAERDYWDREVGGGLGATELWRRLIPHRRRQIEQYNPIENDMPDWLPGSGDRSPDFRHGDPFSKIQLGEERLPGRGYAALNSELEDVDPKDYPALHRFKILADVAPYSEKFDAARIATKQDIKEGRLSAEEIARFDEIEDQVRAKRERKDFTPYKYRERVSTPIEEILAQQNEQAKTAGDQSSWFGRTVGRYWETLAHHAESPSEFLTPLRPGAKLVHMRTAIEDYKKTQLYGSTNAFWNKPVEDFIKPFLSSVAHAVGWDGIPGRIKEKRDLNEYFDILKYVKFTSLKRQAQAAGDEENAKEFEGKRRETLFGINPYTQNYEYLYRSMPKSDRDYFTEFVQADMEERKEIFQMIPENEKALLSARWQLEDAADMQKAIKQGLLTEEQVQKSEQVLATLYEEKTNEGMPKDKELWVDYLKTRQQGESYPDWYRRTKLLEQSLRGRSLPGPDWVGFSPQVDLEDIRLKVVEYEGRNMYDYDLWQDRERAVARRPVINKAAEELMQTVSERISPEETRSRINEVLARNKIVNPHIEMIQSGRPGNRIDFITEEDRTRDVERIIRKRGLM